MTHHLQADPDIFHRSYGLLIVDRDYGYRGQREKTPQPRDASGRFVRRTA